MQQVLNDIRKELHPRGLLRADHLSRLNPAVFSLSGRGAVDGVLALKVVQTVDKIHTARNAEEYDNSDSAFFSIYLALLGAMQNQVILSEKQNEKLGSWIKLAVEGSGKLVYLLDKALETENEKLRLQLSRLSRAEAVLSPGPGSDERLEGIGHRPVKSGREPPLFEVWGCSHN